MYPKLLFAEVVYKHKYTLNPIIIIKILNFCIFITKFIGPSDSINEITLYGKNIYFLFGDIKMKSLLREPQT